MHIWLRLHTAEVSFMHAYVPHEQPMPIKDMSIGGSQCLEVAGAEHVVALQYVLGIMSASQPASLPANKHACLPDVWGDAPPPEAQFSRLPSPETMS